MTETSRFWDGVVTGDAVQAPYDALFEFSQVLQAMTGTAPNAMANGGGVFAKIEGELSPGAFLTSVVVGTGAAMVDGTYYHNSATITYSFPIPVTSTRIDRIILRKDYVAQTIRQIVLTGVEGGSEPALVHNRATYWDIPIASISITTGNVLTLTDERELIGGINGLIGPSNTKMTKYVALRPGLVTSYPIAGTSSGVLTLPMAIPPKTIAINALVTISAFGHSGSVGLADHANNLASYYAVTVSYPTPAGGDEKIGIINADPAAILGGQCTIEHTTISTGNLTLNLIILGYWEYVP